MDIADEVGLDTETLSKDWSDVDVETTTQSVEPPETTIHIDGTTVSYSGYFHPDDVKTMFEQAGFEEHEPPRRRWLRQSTLGQAG